MSHTNGPLECDRRARIELENGEVVDVFELTTVPKDGGFTTTGYVFSKEDAELYSAAPELLAIAQRFCERVETGEIHSRSTYAEFKAAISKAEGKVNRA